MEPNGFVGLTFGLGLTAEINLSVLAETVQVFFQVHRFQVPETYLQKVAAEQGLEGRLNKAASPAERDGEEIWVPLRHVRYREGPQDQIPPTGDAADAKGLINDHREAEEKTSMSEPLP
ncbi:TPA: pol protein-like [Bos taurus]|nr:TPA: pol protein-like [Bos taurus]